MFWLIATVLANCEFHGVAASVSVAGTGRPDLTLPAVFSSPPAREVRLANVRFRNAATRNYVEVEEPVVRNAHLLEPVTARASAFDARYRFQKSTDTGVGLSISIRGGGPEGRLSAGATVAGQKQEHTIIIERRSGGLGIEAVLDALTRPIRVADFQEAALEAVELQGASGQLRCTDGKTETITRESLVWRVSRRTSAVLAMNGIGVAPVGLTTTVSASFGPTRSSSTPWSIIGVIALAGGTASFLLIWGPRRRRSTEAPAMTKEGRSFDVFLSYSRKDQKAVSRLARRLRLAGLKPWQDVHELRPGERWQEAIADAMNRCLVAAICIGPTGVGTWQSEEAGILLQHAVSQHKRVIPVLLAGAKEDQLSSIPFLMNRHAIRVEDLKSREEIVRGFSKSKGGQ